MLRARLAVSPVTGLWLVLRIGILLAQHFLGGHLLSLDPTVRSRFLACLPHSIIYPCLNARACPPSA